VALIVISGSWSGCQGVPSAGGDDSAGEEDGALLHLALASFEAGPTVFPHGRHARLIGTDGVPIECSRCHHEDEGMSDLLPWRCIDCHPGEKTDPRYHELPT